MLARPHSVKATVIRGSRVRHIMAPTPPASAIIARNGRVDVQDFPEYCRAAEHTSQQAQRSRLTPSNAQCGQCGQCATRHSSAASSPAASLPIKCDITSISDDAARRKSPEPDTTTWPCMSTGNGRGEQTGWTGLPRGGSLSAARPLAHSSSGASIILHSVCRWSTQYLAGRCCGVCCCLVLCCALLVLETIDRH